MLAELVDHVIGVDPDRDWITVAALDSRTAGVITTDRFPATRDGYQDAIAWADAHTVESERVWVIVGPRATGPGSPWRCSVSTNSSSSSTDRSAKQPRTVPSPTRSALLARRWAVTSSTSPAPTTESEKRSGCRPLHEPPPLGRTRQR